MNFTDTGMVRPADGLGRVVIPYGIRVTMHIKPGTLFSVFADGLANEILLKVYHVRCLFCGADEDLTDFADRKVCRSCVAALGDMASQAKPEGQTCARCRHFDRCSWLLQCKPDNRECTWDPSRFRPQGERGEIMTDADGLPAGVRS